MKTPTKISVASIALITLILQILQIQVFAANTSGELVYPLKEVSKLDCRYEEFSKLESNCKQSLPILSSKDYQKYATQNGGYNDYTRFYTVLWGSSYKYGWDMWNGGHQGTDIATAKGTPVYSIADGKVVTSWNEIGWGNVVSVEHELDGKKYVSNYAHMSRILVKKWQKVKAGEQVWEVGSTGNSTGNHLHFQIDLPQLFHPYYYDVKTCPYGYYQISEEWVCFDELARNTIDPFLFLETNGAVLGKYTATTKITPQASQKIETNKQVSKSWVDMSVFERTVYLDYSVQDTRYVQQIMKDLWYYTGNITDNYQDVIPALISYQIKSWILTSEVDDGAGWFGPKTRTQAKKDYLKMFASSIKAEKINVNNTQVIKENTSKNETSLVTQKISRVQLLTREEIEAREIDEFLKNNNMSFKNTFSHIDAGSTEVMQIVFGTRKWKAFRWNTPGEISFEFEENIIDVFPKSFYNFTDGVRDIKITGKKLWNTTLKIKLWDVILKTFAISVWKTWDDTETGKAKIYTPSKVVLWENIKALVILKDQYNNKIIGKQFEWQYYIDAWRDVSYCLKRGTLDTIKSVYSRSCFDDEFQDSLEFDYNDTIWGILVFEYKVKSDSSVDLQVIKNNTWDTLASETLWVQVPHGLTINHPYFSEIISWLQKWNISGFKKWYFWENEYLTQKEARDWIGNTMKNENISPTLKEKLKSEANAIFTPMTRKDFLTLWARYLGSKKSQNLPKTYLDLEKNTQILVASVLWWDYSWKDNFWKNYFQPDAKITKWEAAYLLQMLLKNHSTQNVALK